MLPALTSSYVPDRSVAARRDTLPAGTQITIQIQQPGESLANTIRYTVPAPAVVRDPKTLYDGQTVGTRAGHPLVVRVLNGKLYLTEVLGPDLFMFRGSNLLARSDVVTTFGGLRGQLASGETSFGGLTEPSGVSAPSGFFRKTFADGGVYYGPTPDKATTPDTPVTNDKPTGSLPLPTGAVGRLLAANYVPEQVGVYNPQQFGGNLRYSDRYRFGMNFNPGLSPDERKAYGISLFEQRDQTEADRTSMVAGDGILFLYEHGLFGNLYGNRFMESDLQTVYNTLWQNMPRAGRDNIVPFTRLAFNIEQSIWWAPGNFPNSYPGYSQHGQYGQGPFENWDVAKGRSIKCESDGVTRTLEQLANMGESAWTREMSIRRANRLVLMMEIGKERAAPGTKVAFGSAIYQGPAALSNLNTNNVFLPEHTDVNFIGGKDGLITFSRNDGGSSTYNLAGTVWHHEDFDLDYYYRFTFDIARADYNDIWRDRKEGTQNYPYLWSRIKPIHVTADEKGHWQLMQKRMIAYGGARPAVRLPELVYEANIAGSVDGEFIAARIPFADQQNVLGFDTPKIFSPPYVNASAYIVSRFMEGGRDGSGFLLWNSPARFDLSSEAQYNRIHLHSVTAINQARASLQPYEDLLDNSVLIEDPEVQIGGTGNYEAYDGTTAYGYDGNGGWRTPRPAYSVRYAANDDGSYSVLLLGGMVQAYGQTRTDNVRIQTGPLRNTVVTVNLTGPSAQVFALTVRPGGSYSTALSPAGLAGYAAGVN